MRIKKLVFLSPFVKCLRWSVAGAQPAQHIRIGYPSISSRQAQLWNGAAL
ncbi:MAG TPA: hypothetical protein VFX54_07830 [Candidatus Binatia bacterium]|nr:hypothetical protein [Candidatus Binatia bacterium]